jgi:hypothetical protein
VVTLQALTELRKHGWLDFSRDVAIRRHFLNCKKAGFFLDGSRGIKSLFRKKLILIFLHLETTKQDIEANIEYQKRCLLDVCLRFDLTPVITKCMPSNLFLIFS